MLARCRPWGEVVPWKEPCQQMHRHVLATAMRDARDTRDDVPCACTPCGETLRLLQRLTASRGETRTVCLLLHRHGVVEGEMRCQKPHDAASHSGCSFGAMSCFPAPPRDHNSKDFTTLDQNRDRNRNRINVERLRHTVRCGQKFGKATEPRSLLRFSWTLLHAQGSYHSTFPDNIADAVRILGLLRLCHVEYNHPQVQPFAGRHALHTKLWDR